MLASTRLGRLTDEIGPHKVMLVALVAAGILFIPQAFVTTVWQLGVLRFLIGLATAGILPAINTLIRHNIPESIAGRAFGYNQSAQFLGAFGGSIMGGSAAAMFGIQSVFYFTGALLIFNALWIYKVIYKTGAAA
jgi:MFS family permease